MLVLVFVFVVLLFLAIGVAVFGVFAVTPRTRRYAFSAALWCACWGPCIVALEMLAGLSLAAEGLVLHHWGRENIPLPGMPTWSTYALMGLVGTAVLATLTAWLHQMLIGRMTLALFRFYAACVMAGMGSVVGWGGCLWLSTLGSVPCRLLIALTGMTLLVAGFGYLGWRSASALHGKRPDALQWVTVEEFYGVRELQSKKTP